jgi:hypothetical protein
MAMERAENMASVKQIEGLGWVASAVDCLRPIVISTLQSLDLPESQEGQNVPDELAASLSSSMEIRCARLGREIRALAGLMDRIGEEAGRLKELVTS